MVNINVLVLHAKHLEVRKPICESLRKTLSESSLFENVNFTYIEDYDPNVNTIMDLKNNVSLDKTNKSELFDNLIKNLHVRQVSNGMKHYVAISKVANETNDDDISLILEDDVVFSDQVDQRLFQTIQELKKLNKWDINFLGFPQQIDKDIVQKDVVKLTDVNSIYKILPEVSSYLINKQGAMKLQKVFLPIHFNTPIQFSYLYETNKDLLFKMSSPNVFVDGSKFGVYLSNIESNNKLILNTDYARLYRLVKENERKKPNEITRTNDFETIKFNNHPEFVSLHAQYELQMNNIENSKKLFGDAYKTYMENDCILNGESDFLLCYSRIFKFFQNSI